MLSKIQKEIVETQEKDVVVMASVSAGKTLVLTERVRYLLRQGISPSRIVVITFTNAAAGEMRRRLSNEKNIDMLQISTIHSYANKLLSAYNIPTGDLIKDENFNGFFKLIKQYPEVIQPVDFLLLDEAQDSDVLQMEFIRKYIRPSSIFFVGDFRQCQPAGTKVQLRNNIIKNIEDVEVGDSVVYYNADKAYLSGMNTNGGAVHARVLETKESSFTGKLITVTTENGLTTQYTPNHKAIIRLESGEYNELVYLMADKNNRFRVGTSSLVSMGRKGNSNPWRRKMFNEGCDRIWILDVFKTKKEALLWEDKISYFYQIPQSCWQLDKVNKTQEDIDFIYEDLDTETGAKKCLEFFNRDIRYPFLTSEQSSYHFATNATAMIYACNILPKMMSFLIYEPKLKHKKSYDIIDTIKFEKIEEPILVYSLRVEPFETYVADGIVTHNSIFSFAGSDPSVMIDITREKDVAVYDLNENYRNGRNILHFAKKLLSRGGMRDTGIPMVDFAGEVIDMELDIPWIVNTIKKNGEYGKWFVLTRTNAESERILKSLKAAKIPCDTFKKGNMKDDKLEKKLKENTVKVLTIHTSKGLEADYVVVIGARFYDEEEIRVSYVAATRAKKLLIWTYQPKRKKRKVY